MTLSDKTEAEQGATVQFTLPDLPPVEQLQLVDDLIEVLKTFAALSGDEPNLKPLHDARIKLLSDIAGTDLRLDDPESKVKS